MFIKNTRDGRIIAGIGKESFNLFEKGEQTRTDVQHAITKLQNLLTYDAEVKAIAAQAAMAQDKLSSLKSRIGEEFEAPESDPIGDMLAFATEVAEAAELSDMPQTPYTK